jgi:hypothetical protein
MVVLYVLTGRAGILIILEAFSVLATVGPLALWRLAWAFVPAAGASLATFRANLGSFEQSWYGANLVIAKTLVLIAQNSTALPNPI